MVEGLMSHHCSQVAAAKDHTVVLTEEGYVYTFGLNTFHQLGLTPPPASAYVPKQVEKLLRKKIKSFFFVESFLLHLLFFFLLRSHPKC